MKSNLNLKVLLWTFSLAAIDLIVKIITVKTLGFLKPLKIVGEYIWIIATESVWAQNQVGFSLWNVGRKLIMLLFLFRVLQDTDTRRFKLVLSGPLL